MFEHISILHSAIQDGKIFLLTRLENDKEFLLSKQIKGNTKKVDVTPVANMDFESFLKALDEEIPSVDKLFTVDEFEEIDLALTTIYTGFMDGILSEDAYYDNLNNKDKNLTPELLLENMK
ncbi:MAG: hypothetical protein J5525_12545 [Lachnospiraceae bacterium]|nr:hypothetical protein [Lachnospiraceae bacterium]